MATTDSKELNRVIFHSKEDMSAGYNLKRAEQLLDSLDVEAVHGINDLLELYNIKEYFDNGLFLLTWGQATKDKYMNQIEQAQKKIKGFYFTINDENILPLVGRIEFSYRKAFWYLFNYLQVYKRIDKISFSAVLENHPRQVGYILSHLNLVTHYDTEIRNFLMGYDVAAELLLSKFEKSESQFRETPYIFPKSLSLDDKEGILLRYLDYEIANLNYIRLIEHSKDSGDLKLSAKTRLRAKKKSDELNNQVLEEGVSLKFGVEVVLDKDQIEPAVFSHQEHRLVASYSEQFIDAQKDDGSLFMLFRNLFVFTDHNGLINLVSKQSEMAVMERVFMTSKNEYVTGIEFQHKNQLAFLQAMIFSHYLIQKGRSIEDLIQSFIKLALHDDLKLESIQVRFPTKDSTFLEKIRIVAPELEFLLKQYQVYSTEGKIDFELIQIDSIPLKFGDVKSVLSNKYVYIKESKAKTLQFQFYSDQSLLHYIEPFKDKYSNLYDLLQNEEVAMDHFNNYQQDVVKQLIADDYLFVDQNNHVKIKNDIMIYLIGDLYRNEVISYWHYPKEVREELDEMERENYIRFGNSLLTEPEINYFNYYLNKKRFTNGLNIRNKYLHGSNSGSEKDHEFEYNILLILIILTILKIVDDLVLQKRIAEES